MSVNQFIENMAAAGFSGAFIASNGIMTIKGEIKDGKVIKRKVPAISESRAKIKEILGGGANENRG